MPIRKADAKRLMRSFKTDLGDRWQTQIDLRVTFMDDDDWSSVIKRHALVESNVSELILAHIGDARLHPVVDRLPLANDGTGKLALAKELELLDGRQRGFVKKRSELRNTLVHDVNQPGFVLQDYVGASHLGIAGRGRIESCGLRHPRRLWLRGASPRSRTRS